MKNFLCLFLSLFLLIPCIPVWQVSATDDSAVIESFYFEDILTTHGRTYFDDDGALHFNWTHSGFSFAFNGTAASVKLRASGSVYLDVYVDGADTPTSTISLGGVSEKVLAEGLDDGYHTIKVLKRSENGWGGTVYANELTIFGEIADPPEKPLRKIEVIGDSITAGYGNLISDGSVNGYRVQDQNGNLTFATIAGNSFGAEMSVIAKSGIGFAYNNGGGNTDTMKDAYIYTDYFGYNKTTEWDFEENENDVVIIALGTNDTSAPSSTAHYEGAKNFLSLVREKNPDAVIIWAYEIMTASYSDQLKRVVKEANDAGDNKVFYHSLGLINKAEDGIGAAGHPSMATHERDAVGLAELISEVTGWKIGTDGTEIPDSVRLKNDSILTAIDENTVFVDTSLINMFVSVLKKEFYDNEYIVITDADGKTVADNTKVATNMKVNIVADDEVHASAVLVVEGDVDGNGGINATDALLALQAAVNKIELDAAQTHAALVSGGENVTASDALMILQFAVGKIKSFDK